MMILSNLWGRLMAMVLPQPKERRSNRASVPEKYVRQYARLHKTLMDIANTTKAEMPDDEFRKWAQDEAHMALANTRMIP